jgi:hypothetical protein
MQAFDCLNLLRRLINDPVSGGSRFSDATLLSFIDVAQVQAVRETSSPDAYQVFSTQNILTLSGTPTTGENVVLNINNVLITVAETTGQTLTALAALVSAAVNASVAINTVVNSTPVANAITFVALGTGFTGNSATLSMTQGVHVTGIISYVQEYQVFEQLVTNAVYCAGKLLTPSSPAIMEGWNNGIWEQSSGPYPYPGSTSVPASGFPPPFPLPIPGTVPFPGSGAVPGTVGGGNPDWENAWPKVYPSQTGQEHCFKPTVQPIQGCYQGHMAERYYWRDCGTIGLVPQPANLCQVVIYGVCLPPPVTTTATLMIIPLSYKMYVVRYAEWLCRSSENTSNPGQQLLIENAYNDMMRERASCILKVRNAKGKIPRTFNSIPQRLSRARYCVRRSGSRW